LSCCAFIAIFNAVYLDQIRRSMSDTEKDPGDEQPTRSKAMLAAVGVLALFVASVIGGLWLTPGGRDIVASLINDGSAEEVDEIHPAESSDGHDAPKSTGHEALKSGSHGTADATHGKTEGHGDAATPALTVTPFKEIIVNINATTATGRTTSRFMKLNIAMVYDSHAPGAERIEERRLFLRDSFQDYLRQLNERDLRGTIGLVTIKQDLLHRARTITDSNAPQEVLVADLIVQ
jgi:flagellar protein FliL